MRAEDFVELMRELLQKEQPAQLAFGTIDPTYTVGLPKVVFDGELTASVKAYPHNRDYTPAASDRVALIGSGRSWLILCAIEY